MSKERKINLRVPFITRLEGEGALELSAKDNHIQKLHLKIFEPPRLFEKFLTGKPYSDVPDLSARICGICPMAYQLTSILAFEKLFEVKLPKHLVELRRLMNFGEWIQSHALHIHFLAMPDFLGFDSALQMAEKHGDLLRNGMQIQEAGNSLMSLLGGRSVHPVGLKVGGFSKLPTQENWDKVYEKVQLAIPAADKLLHWVSELAIPDYSHEFTYVSLKGNKSYPINGGDIWSSNGLKIPQEDYKQHFNEHQVRHSTAFYSLLEGQDYLLGPLARMNSNFSLLPPKLKKRINKLGLKFPNTNMFTSIQARVAECYYCLLAALDILEKGLPIGEASMSYNVKAGWTCFSTEAPRGLIYHEYEVDDDGIIRHCSIIPPTSQNQARIENDLKQSVAKFGLDRKDSELKAFCEQVIRNYDPCISCSTHFLKFSLKRL